MQRLAGRVTIISGGGTGIGRAIAIAAASEGAHVIVAGRSRSTLEEVASLTGGQAVTCDVTQIEEVQALFSAARRITGKVDVLVNMPDSPVLSSRSPRRTWLPGAHASRPISLAQSIAFMSRQTSCARNVPVRS